MTFSAKRSTGTTSTQGRYIAVEPFDIEITFFDNHGLEDDSGIEFTRYEYQLQLVAFRVGLRMSTFKSLHDAMSLFLAERLADILQCETMVVENLQTKVAVFAPDRSEVHGS